MRSKNLLLLPNIFMLDYNYHNEQTFPHCHIILDHNLSFTHKKKHEAIIFVKGNLILLIDKQKVVYRCTTGYNPSTIDRVIVK